MSSDLRGCFMKKSKLAIIFDFDNTLVKSNINFPAMKINMARHAKKYGLDFGKDEEIPNRYTAGNIIDEVEKYDKKNGTNLTEELWEMVEKFERMGMENITIDQDIYTMLENLKEREISLSILTNNSKNPTVEVLERFNIASYFDTVIAREDVERMKPDKEGLIKIIEDLSLNLDDVIFIGDSWVDGVAATNANIRFILIRKRTLDPVKYNIKIWKHVKTIKELDELLKNS